MQLESLPTGATRFAAVDVQYHRTGGATAALVVSSDVTFSQVEVEHVAEVMSTEPYETGLLFKRELPCIRVAMAACGAIDLLLVDGYCTLDPHGRMGLGAHAAEAFNIPVVGVAKTRFRTATHAREVLRGQATRPLFVTACQIDSDEAARMVAGMAGPNRIPDALARVDQLARGIASPAGL